MEVHVEADFASHWHAHSMRVDVAHDDVDIGANMRRGGGGRHHCDVEAVLCVFSGSMNVSRKDGAVRRKKVGAKRCVLVDARSGRHLK